MGKEAKVGAGTCRSRVSMSPTVCSRTSSSGDLQPPRHACDIQRKGRTLSTAGWIQSANVIVDCWKFVISVYRPNIGHQRLSVFALLGERMPWDVSVPKVQQDRPVSSPILHYLLALYPDRPMASPILRRHHDLAGHIPRLGGRAAVMDRRSVGCGCLRRWEE